MLKAYGVGGKLLKTVLSFYVNSWACIMVGVDVSEWFPVNVGLRQGCVCIYVHMDGHNGVVLSQEKFHRDAHNRSHPALPETSPMPEKYWLHYPTGRRDQFTICSVTAPPKQQMNIYIMHFLHYSRHSYSEKHWPEQ